MKSIIINYDISKLSAVFLICFLFCALNLFYVSIAVGSNVWVEVEKLTASDAEGGDEFGYSVAVAGDVSVVGAYLEDTGGDDAGAAYIFERNIGGTNAWGESKKLMASGAQAGNEFGCSVSVAGDVAVVGAYLEDAGDSDTGAAYIFERNTGGINSWGEMKKLVASDAEANDEFGISVAVADDVAVVGAHWEDTAAVKAGAAYIFERNMGGADTWGEMKKLTASDAQANDNFGISVAMAGDVAVVGADWEDEGGATAGAAYIFERNAGGANTWGEVKKLIASDAEAWDHFGWSVAVAGDVVVVGAWAEDAGGSDAGAAYVFERNAGGANAWGEVKKLTASDAQLYDKFGESVAVAGDVTIVGAWDEDSIASWSGAAYIFERNAGGTDAWGEVKKLTASDAELGDRFGWSVAIAGDVAVIGANWEDAGGNNAGAAYVFENFIFLPPQIATNALIFPSANSVIFALPRTNIVWDVEKITDNSDGTNLTISKITLHYADTTNYILEITNNIANTLGEIEWKIEAGSWDGKTNYVLKFEVVDSSSLTNSRIFRDNKFAIVPEPGILWIIGLLELWIIGRNRRKFLPKK